MSIEETSRPQPSGFLTFVWALFFFLVFALFVLIWVKRDSGASTVDDTRAQARISKRLDLEKADHDKLMRASWVDKSKGIVHLPIADAKRLVLAELSSKKVSPSQVKVEPPLPPAAPYDPNAAEPALILPSSPQGADTLRFDLNAAAPAPAAAAPTQPSEPKK